MNNFLPGLYIVSTPIGNLEDITLRALNVLKSSDQILCEDTRRSIKLLNYYKIKKKLVANHKFNEKKIVNSIINFLQDGKIRLNLSTRVLDDGVAAETTQAIQLERWQHVAATYDGSKTPEGMRIYVNGIEQELEGLLDLVGNRLPQRYPLRIGASGSTKPNFQTFILLSLIGISSSQTLTNHFLIIF